jgi:uncharacterized damage-inducible protein DinB
MAHLLTQHLTYNLWANERIGHLLMAQDDTRLDLEQKNSFTSIRKTLFHIWDAEVIWFARLKGDSVRDWPSKKFSGSKAEMLHGFIKNSTELLAFVTEKGSAYQQQPIVYKSIKGDAYENTVEEILFHLVNHGTYHRGQIITLLHGAGATQMVSTDLIAWFRERKKS